MLIHIHREGDFFGPYTLEQAKAYVASGHLLADDQAWVEDGEGAQEWVPLAHLVGDIPAPPPITEREDRHLPAWIPPRRTDATTPPVFIQRLSPAVTPLRNAAAAPRPPTPVTAPTSPLPEAQPIVLAEEIPAPHERGAGMRNMGIGAVVALGGAVAIYRYYESAAVAPDDGAYFFSWAAVIVGTIWFLRGAAQLYRAGR